LILLDDVGFGQFSVTGGGVPSPNMEKLAKQEVTMKRQMNGVTILMLALAWVLLLGLWPMSANAQNKKPNLVMIRTDDVGWGDLGSYGGGVMRGAPTPNLDRMAAEGMRFVNYYGQASCTAGRASFITGRIPIRNNPSPRWKGKIRLIRRARDCVHGKFTNTSHGGGGGTA
jgi:hypothetical protein